VDRSAKVDAALFREPTLKVRSHCAR